MECVRYLGRRKGRRPAMHAAMVVALGFLIIILTGAVLLTLPISAYTYIYWGADRFSGRSVHRDFGYLRDGIGHGRHSDTLVWFWAGGHSAVDSDRRTGLYVSCVDCVLSYPPHHHAARAHGDERRTQPYGKRRYCSADPPRAAGHACLEGRVHCCLRRGSFRVWDCGRASKWACSIRCLPFAMRI